MRCLNCNLTVPDGAKTCPFCKAKIDDKHQRCPECFVKLNTDETVCPKCGCDLKNVRDDDFEFYKEDKKNKSSKLKTAFLKHKTAYICILSAITVCILAVVITLYSINKRNEYDETLRAYSQNIEYSMDSIDMLAEEYNKVYDGQWLYQVENIAKLEKKYSDTIGECKAKRDSITFMYRKLKDSGKKSNGRIIEKAFDSYEKCYLYVVEKHGKNPGYMKGYTELNQKYKSSIKKLDDILK